MKCSVVPGMMLDRQCPDCGHMVAVHRSTLEGAVCSVCEAGPTISIEGKAAIVGPDECLVVTLPAWVSAEEHDQRVTEFEEAIKGGPLAGRVLLMSGIQDIAVVKGCSLIPPTSESGVNKEPDGRR